MSRYLLFCVYIFLVCELGTFIVAALFTNFRSLSKTYNLIFFVLVVFVSLCISFSGITATARCGNPLFSFLGKISLPLYCFHDLIIQAVNSTNFTVGVRIIIVYLGPFVFACFMQWIIETICPKVSSTCCKLLIQTPSSI